MSFQPSRTETIKTLFQGNRFTIPAYQRKYSWGFDERKALWDDIAENIKMKHFIGTLCFKRVENSDDIFSDMYEIIDGQQRVTTLFILLNVLIEKLEDNSLQSGFMKLYIGESAVPKLKALGVDEQFLNMVIFNYSSIHADSLIVRSQINIHQAKSDFIGLTSEFKQEEIITWINFISNNIEILIFNVAQQSESIKMFSVINDRGLPLSNLDKTKSLLMLYSTLYLNEELNESINKQFGEIFDFFDEMVFLKNKLGLFRTLDNADFENTFYTHFYYSASKHFPDWDYQLGADSIFKQLKRHTEKSKLTPSFLRSNIENYVSDFHSFAKAYSLLFRKIDTDDFYKQYFLMMEFTATLYPLIVCLFQQGKLEPLIQTLEVIEMRVYKLKNTNPRRDMYHLASDIMSVNKTTEEINQSLFNFANNFCNDYYTKDYLSEPIDSKTSFVRYLFYKNNMVNSGQKLSLDDFRNIQVEHIFSQNPNHKIKQYGFYREETYSYETSRLGNLTILEKALNKEVNNLAPADKLEGYQKSEIKINTNILGVLSSFNKDAIQERTEHLTTFFMQEFNIPSTN